MGEIDTLTKQYMEDNDRFADLINSFVFNGKQVIQADDLSEMDISAISVPYLEKEDDAVQKARDVLKKCIVKYAGNAIFVVYGVENQARIHYAMPIRNMLYDAINYENQASTLAKHNKELKGLNRAEFLSKFRKEDKLIPVITLTLYWGTEKWDGPRTLHEMFRDLPPEIKELVPDYQINLISPAEMGKEDIEKFQTELNKLFFAIHAGAEGSAALAGLAENEMYSDITIESARILDKVLNLNIPIPEEGGTMDMCKAMQDLKEMYIEKGVSQGRLEGRIEGRIEGRSEGRSEGRLEGRIDTLKKVIKVMITKDGKSFDEACTDVEVTPEEMKILKDLIFK